nr:MAG TPA: hypothetical protein [Caudoviricetes sp.]
MSEPYTLKKAVNDEALKILNSDWSPAVKISTVFRVADHPETEEEAKDRVTAIFSGKEIVNPLSPREELKREIDYAIKKKEMSIPDTNIYGYFNGLIVGLNQATEIIAKKHPDVKDWLKEGEAE